MKSKRRVCADCALDRLVYPRIGRPCPECGSICGCDWHLEIPKPRTRQVLHRIVQRKSKIPSRGRRSPK